jgi:hypothetical protein
MSLQTLQGMLDESRRNASPFTNSLEGEVQSAVQLEQFVNATRNVTLAVVRSGGLPHAAPVIGGCIDGGIHVTVSPGSVLANCLERSPEVAFTMADVVHTLIGAGTAEELGRATELFDVRQRLDAASPMGEFAPPGWDGFIYLLHPRRLFAW